jgi:hypothetical protein
MTKNEILNQMKGRSVTNGWDVVCAMSAKNISRLFEDKYNMGKESGLLYDINFIEKCEFGSIFVHFHVGSPLISFIKDDPTRCTLRLEIIKGKSYLMDTSSKVLNEQIIPRDSSDKDKYFITSIIPLATIEGTVNNSHDVVIDFNQTESVHIDLKFSDTIKLYVSNALKNYFTTTLEKKCWSLGTLIYEENPHLLLLTPKEFEFATSVSPGDKSDDGCLMLFITTRTGTKGTANELTGKDGRLYIPFPDEYSAALIISNEFFYKNILLPQLPAKPAEWAFKEGATKLEAGYCYSSGGSVKFEEYSSGGLNQWTISAFTMNFNEGNPPLSLKDGETGNLIFQWKNNWMVNWNNNVNDPSGGHMPTHGHMDISVEVINPDVKISIEEPSQAISFQNNAAVKLNVPSDNSICEKMFGGSVVAGKLINTKIDNELPKLNVEFKGVNVFAASNLLFPADHIITYDAVGVLVPGDLVIFGTTKQKLK